MISIRFPEIYIFSIQLNIFFRYFFNDLLVGYALLVEWHFFPPKLERLPMDPYYHHQGKKRVSEYQKKKVPAAYFFSLAGHHGGQFNLPVLDRIYLHQYSLGGHVKFPLKKIFQARERRNIKILALFGPEYSGIRILDRNIEHFLVMKSIIDLGEHGFQFSAFIKAVIKTDRIE
jgi:hypothetical protein